MIKLYELRLEKNLSQRAIAKEMCISQATYNNWENGKTQPSIEQLIMLADFFDVSVDFLIGKEGDEQMSHAAHEDTISLFYGLEEDSRELVKALIRKLQK